jgi:energy-coupling factor transporter ATP-binding protein EcfA2
MPILSVRDLTFTYPGVTEPTLAGVSFDVERGECLAIFGAAKSTLCLCLAGAIPHLISGRMEGDVIVDGVSTRAVRLAELATKVGMVLQDPENTLFNLTLEGDLVFGMENLGTPRDDMTARLEEVLALVGLSGLRGRMSQELSGGQKQRAAVAAVLAMRPSILILDEPTRELDPLGTEEVFGLLASLKERGTTIVIVENDPDHVAPLADRMLLLREGRLAVLVPPREFYAAVRDDPKIRFPQVTDLYLALQHRVGLDGQIPITLEEGITTLGPLYQHARH